MRLDVYLARGRALLALSINPGAGGNSPLVCSLCLPCLGFSGDFCLTKVWDLQAWVVSPVVLREPRWCGAEVWTEEMWSAGLWLRLSLLGALRLSCDFHKCFLVPSALMRWEGWGARGGYSLWWESLSGGQALLRRAERAGVVHNGYFFLPLLEDGGIVLHLHWENLVGLLEGKLIKV